ncbi:MAG: 50S ribosomal protein L21 [Methylovirgula sp.]
MFAVIKTGGKQYSVAAEDVIAVMTLPGAPGDAVTFENVLMLVDGEAATFGAPFLEGAKVIGTIIDHKRGPKVLAFKKRRRKNSKRKHGHRQDLTMVKITGVLPSEHQANA